MQSLGITVRGRSAAAILFGRLISAQAGLKLLDSATIPLPEQQALRARADLLEQAGQVIEEFEAHNRAALIWELRVTLAVSQLEMDSLAELLR